MPLIPAKAGTQAFSLFRILAPPSGSTSATKPPGSPLSRGRADGDGALSCCRASTSVEYGLGLGQRLAERRRERADEARRRIVHGDAGFQLAGQAALDQPGAEA